jgi:hypothetical protein
MSTAIAFSLEGQPSDQPIEEILVEASDWEVEEPRWEPRRIRVPRSLVWGTLIVFIMAILVMGAWGLTRSTWTYGMTPLGPGTTADLTRIHRALLAAGVPESALRHLAAAARPGINIGDAIEALVDADKDLDRLSANPAVASAQSELRRILSDLKSWQYAGPRIVATPSFTVTPGPPLEFPAPQSP